jgi:hypothetical protein
MCVAIDWVGIGDGFIDHLYTPLVSTNNYSTIDNLHTLQIITEPAKHFQTCCLYQPLPGNGF